MTQVAFTAAEVASWHDAAFVVLAAKAFGAGRISGDELRLVAAYAAGGTTPASDLVARVLG